LFRRAVSAVLLTVILTSMLPLMFNIQPLKSGEAAYAQALIALPTDWPSVYIYPEVAEADVGETFTVSVVVFNLTDNKVRDPDNPLVVRPLGNLYGFDIQLSWDPGILELDAYTITQPVENYPTPIPPSPYAGILHADTMKLKEKVDETANIPDSEPGTMAWFAYSSMYPAPVFNGNGTFFTLTFNAKASGTCNLKLVNVWLSDDTGTGLLFHQFDAYTAKFTIGDWVQTTANLNVREGPGLSYTIIDTMPLGTIGQIMGGPVEADGFEWWNVNYTLGVTGWSAENWLELHVSEAPTCVVELQIEGVEISEVGVWEFFDIYVGDSTSDMGINQVRFSSDNVQDGYPTGRWTDWLDWGTSSEDWNATTKIKRWAFDKPGYKEVWAEVKDETDLAAVDFAPIFVPAPALPVITSALVITPTKDIYNVGDSLTAEFTIENLGEVQITLDNLTVGGRLNGAHVKDFPHQQITLQPHTPFVYTGSLTLTNSGSHHFFIAYHIADPTPEEKELLDANNWNTCVQLREGLTHADRVKNVLVFEAYVEPEDVMELEDDITQALQMHVEYPRHVLDEWNFGEALGVLWNDFTAWRSNENQNQLYEQFYQEGINYDSMRCRTLYNARTLLHMGDFTNAKRLWRQSYDLAIMSCQSFGAAAQVFANSLEPAMKLANKVLDKAMQLLEIGIKIASPEAAVAVSWFFTGVRYAVNVNVWGMDPSDALDKAMIERIVKFLFSEAVCPNLGGRTLENYLGNRVGAFLGFDAHLIQELFGDPQLESLVYATIKEYAVSMGEDYVIRFTQKAEEIALTITDQLRKTTESIKAQDKSPVEIKVYDLQSAMTGLENGRVSQDISRSVYYNETVWILFPSDCYYFDLMGRENGTYGLKITFTDDGNSTIFNAIDIPVSTNTEHAYVIDWGALSVGGEGITVFVDAEGDGLVDRVFSCDNELASEEFIEKTSPTYPTYALTITTGENGTTFPPPSTYVCSANSAVQVTTIPDEGYVLDYWELDIVNVGSNNPYTVLMQENHTLNAVFRPGIYDIAITSVWPSKIIVGEDYSLSTNVTVANLGDFIETFSVTLYANAAAIAMIEIILAGGTSTNITLIWNTTSFSYGNYTIWAYAEPVPEETFLDDNTFVYGWVIVSIPGDVDGDFHVNLYDAVALLFHYGAKQGQPAYDIICDIDGDGDIDLYDAVVLLTHYGQKYP
jgi:hypothetical protein